ncbi:molybdopterin molybdotransferase MoeA [Haloferula sargassicola]|uniref:Molybdopterin molybdenumtransferase n=1 Tax=Haloferula sargassicola TaxID=490096 RepID=A0ABP9UUJ3_9BACT
MDRLISTAEADALITAAVPAVTAERVPLAEALGRTLAAPILADRDLPPYPRSMMDGIAFHSSSAQPLAIQGLHAAGDPPPAPLQPNHAWEIMTGASVPADCDTVIPYEDLEWLRRPAAGRGSGGPPQTQIQAAYHPGQFIHPTGSDAKAGDILIPAGRLIGPAEIAIAASVGATHPEVAARPRIALITSGDEVVPPDAAPEPWQIRASNGPMLEAALRQLGHAAVSHHIPDEPEAARATLHRALDTADLLILCGGISKGKKDLIRPLLEERLGPPAFHGVRQRPGKPLAFWPGPPTVFALPGNPVSVLATFTRHVIPFLIRREGREPHHPKRFLPKNTEPLPKFAWFLALDAAGNPLPPRNSGDFVSISGLTGFLEIPPSSDFTQQPLSFFPLYPFS